MKNKKKMIKSYKNPDFLSSPEARPIRILSEFIEPQSRFKEQDINSTVVFFGSARIKSRENAKIELKEFVNIYEKDPTPENEDRLALSRLHLRLSKYYEDAVELSRLITEWSIEKGKGKQNCYICSGGGPGIMEAANKGAHLAKGKSIGLNISLPMEQDPNPFISHDLIMEFHYFFMRKYWFAYLAKALIIFPGGFGTLDELMELLTLIQTRKIEKALPILIFGQDYWKEIIDFDAMARWGTISPKDLELFTFVNSPEDAFHLLKDHLERSC